MYVICDTADTKAFTIGIASNGRQVGVQTGSNSPIEDRCPVFAAEDEMDEEKRQRLWHGEDDVAFSPGPTARRYPSLGQRPRNKANGPGTRPTAQESD